MKPASLATVLLRLIALLTIGFSLIYMALTLMVVLSMGALGAVPLIAEAVIVFFAVMIFIWSKPLGQWVARGLD